MFYLIAERLISVSERVLVLGNAQLAQMVGARGPNMQTNAACAGSTLGVAMAQVYSQRNAKVDNGALEFAAVVFVVVDVDVYVVWYCPSITWYRVEHSVAPILHARQSFPDPVLCTASVSPFPLILSVTIGRHDNDLAL